MDFFRAQERARQATKWLVTGYVLATLLIVAGVTLIVAFALAGLGGPAGGAAGFTGADVFDRHAGLLAVTAAATALFIVGASLFRTASLAAGGSRVATSAGGTPVAADVTEPLRRRLRNVVEEIAIASGVPVPAIYVLEAERGINAFAAGYTPGDAAIAVTRGALETLDRDELQGVIAHEFSHVLNGDMRLNIRLMGVLFGIMVLGLIGRMIVRGGYHASIVSSRRDRNAPVILIVGAGIAVLGAIGVFFARLIKASVSRQRERLADASAVQFTRQTRGIAGALKKIAGYEAGSWLEATDPEEISHMLFGSGAKLGGWFATHPPLVERIRALDPSFDPADFPRVTPRQAPAADTTAEHAAASALIGQAQAVSADAIVASVGSPEDRHIGYAGALRAAVPESLDAAAHSPDLAFLLAVACALDPRDGSVRRRQLALLDERLGTGRRRMADAYATALAEAGPHYRLPLLEMAFPALKERPREQLGFLLEIVRRLIEQDGHVDVREYCYYRVLASHLDQATDPGRRAARHVPESKLRHARLVLLGLVADAGQPGPDERERAFASGAAVLGAWAEGETVVAGQAATVTALDASLDTLQGLDFEARRQLVKALAATVVHDGRLAVAEAEMLRAVCATLDCPLPPILKDDSTAWFPG
ncbi:MAG TPA: M48 family metallopeptidase [Woeseiaceae bacterium]|nr:M48 family metallopeptidase [Woeseiaceae bacterium]